MIRKFAIGFVAVASLVLATFAPPVDAQTSTPCSYANYIAHRCAGTAGGYPENGFAPIVTPTPKPTPKPTSSAVVSADTVAATTGSGSSGGASIAFTGSESRVLGYTGAGLIGLGALALVAARRKREASID